MGIGSFEGDYLLALIGFNLTVFVLLITFYSAYSKNLFEFYVALVEKLEGGKERKTKILDLVYDYFHLTDLASGLTIIYVWYFTVVCLLVLLALNRTVLWFPLFSVSYLVGCLLLFGIYFILITAVLVSAYRSGRHWVRQGPWRQILYRGVLVILPMIGLMWYLAHENYFRFSRGSGGDLRKLLFEHLVILFLHLFVLVVVQFVAPLMRLVNSLDRTKMVQ